MKKKKKRKMKITKGERFVYSLGIMSFIMALVLQIFMGASISNLDLSVEKVKKEINEQNKTNESLIMQVNELTSFDKVSNVVKDMGLAYNNENIVIVE